MLVLFGVARVTDAVIEADMMLWQSARHCRAGNRQASTTKPVTYVQPAMNASTKEEHP